MITDVELGKSGGEVCRVAREEVSMNAVECAFDLPMHTTYKLTGVTAIVNITHQEGDIAVHEEVFGMSNE